MKLLRPESSCKKWYVSSLSQTVGWPGLILLLDDDGSPGVPEAGSFLLSIPNTDIARIVDRLVWGIAEERVNEGVAGGGGGDGESDFLENVDGRGQFVCGGWDVFPPARNDGGELAEVVPRVRQADWSMDTGHNGQGWAWSLLPISLGTDQECQKLENRDHPAPDINVSVSLDKHNVYEIILH